MTDTTTTPCDVCGEPVQLLADDTAYSLTHAEVSAEVFREALRRAYDAERNAPSEGIERRMRWQIGTLLAVMAEAGREVDDETVVIFGRALQDTGARLLVAHGRCTRENPPT